MPGNADELRLLVDVVPSEDGARCRFDDGDAAEVSAILGHFLQRNDQLRFLGATTEVLIRRPMGRSCQQVLHATIGAVGLPKSGSKGEGFVRAELPACQDGPRALFLSAESVRQYFYMLGESQEQSLYQLLNVQEAASPDQLRLGWRMRSLELTLSEAKGDRPQVERAFNVLAHPDLRKCYDAMRLDDDALPLFPYGGFGKILVDGHLSDKGDAFFADRILAYRPEMAVRKVNLLLRQCEFLGDRVVCRDRRRKLEVWLDSNALPGLGWNLTWNHWKHWLRSRIEVEATFVQSGKYRLHNGDWILRKWQVALPSRVRVVMPVNLSADTRVAQQINTLLGQYADLIQHVRKQGEKSPVEHTQVQAWFDQVGASACLKPHYVTWCPDYEPFYFDQLRKRCRTWFLFRDEYLFVWENVLIAEIPESGHATYVFAKPDHVESFLARYATLTREDIRRNRDNLATALGFVGRVVRGKRKKRWLADVLKLAGERTDYIEAFD